MNIKGTSNVVHRNCVMLPNTENEQLVLLIPAYKPSSQLPDILMSVMTAPNSPIEWAVVVDDGSGADFAEIFQRVEQLRHVCLLRHAINLGKGAALKTGINFALTNWPTTTGVITADADGQHSPADIVAVARELKRCPQALILGARRFGGPVPLRSWLGNTLTRQVFRVATGKSFTDTQTGLRGWPRSACLSALRTPLNGYDFELACLVQADQAVHEIPIETIYLDGNQSSHFNPILDSMRVYFVFLRYCGSAVLAAIVDSAVFFSLSHSGESLMLAQIAGRTAAATVAFFVARNVVFRSEARIAVTLMRYVGLLILMGFVSFTLLQALHERIGFSVIGAKLAAESLLFLASFALQRDFIFTPRQE